MDEIHSTILRKTDPFVLDATVEQLEKISPNANPNPIYPLPLQATAATGSSDEDRPFLETSFNKLDKANYRSPWKPLDTGETDIFELEQSANEVWDAYRQLYYGHDAIGSVFVRRKGSSIGTGSTPSKAKKTGGSLEALFGIQKKCFGEEGSDETARWDSVHTVTIEVPNFEEGTCEYKIKSAVWCRYKPEDVGDVPKAERPKKAAAASESPKKALTKSPTSNKPNLKLNISRLEVFDRAANHWDSKHGSSKTNNQTAPVVDSDKPLPPVPAVVKSSAMYTKDTTKFCRLLQHQTKKSTKAIPIASHIQNIGTLLEKIEADFRSKLERVDSPKCVEVLQGMYRPSLSPGLKLPNGSRSSSNRETSMVSKLGGHATGMGVGKGLIGEIALKAKSKGLGNESGSVGSNSTITNKAMENILANEKKKLKDLDDGCSTSSPSKAPNTWNQAGLKKSKTVTPTSSSNTSVVSDNVNDTNKSTAPPGAELFGRQKLRRAKSGHAAHALSPLRRTAAGSATTKAASTSEGGSKTPPPSGNAGLLKRPNLRKAVSVRAFDATAAPPPEFMNFRSKLRKSTAAK